jgi:hypothetical protein
MDSIGGRHASPTLPIVQAAGHKPEMSGEPGSIARISICLRIVENWVNKLVSFGKSIYSPSCKAHLVPRRNHAPAEVEIVVGGLAQSDYQAAVLGGHGGRIIPFVVVRAPIVKID